MDWTLECPGQARKLVRGIGWWEQGLSRNSAAKTLAACTQMRILQRRHWQPARRCEFGNAQRLVRVMGLTWHDLKLGRRTVQGIQVTQQLTQQELADGAARWACRTWVSGSHGLPRSWDHGAKREGWSEDCSTSYWIKGSWAVIVHYLLENMPLRSWRSWGKKCLTMSWKIGSWVCLAAHILGYK